MVDDAITIERAKQMYLFFDTETSGLPDQKKPASWEGQPRVCQLGAILSDEHGYVKAEMNFLVRPDGWDIPPAAAAIHGISQNTAERYGLSIKGVLTILARLLMKADVLVAHNIAFDLFMLAIETQKTQVALDMAKTHFCTMYHSKGILKLPPSARMAACGMTGYKSPNLQEAHRHFFGRDFEGAHDAMADVRACRDVYFALQKLDVTGSTGAAA